MYLTTTQEIEKSVNLVFELEKQIWERDFRIKALEFELEVNKRLLESVQKASIFMIGML
jgi:hypothetical protein